MKRLLDCVINMLVLIFFFVVLSAEKLCWCSLILDGFIYSEKNIRGLGYVLRKGTLVLFVELKIIGLTSERRVHSKQPREDDYLLFLSLFHII